MEYYHATNKVSSLHIILGNSKNHATNKVSSDIHSRQFYFLTSYFCSWRMCTSFVTQVFNILMAGSLPPRLLPMSEDLADWRGIRCQASQGLLSSQVTQDYSSGLNWNVINSTNHFPFPWNWFPQVWPVCCLCGGSPLEGRHPQVREVERIQKTTKKR